MPKTRVLFVCTGNICRSPLAEGIFLHKIVERGVADRFVVDSAGTGGWHAGERPDRRSVDIALQYGVSLPGRARQVTRADHEAFDLLICMDDDNVDRLIHAGAPPEKVRRILDSDPDTRCLEVPDPYYSDGAGFETVFGMLDRACDRLLDELLST